MTTGDQVCIIKNHCAKPYTPPNDGGLRITSVQLFLNGSRVNAKFRDALFDAANRAGNRTIKEATVKRFHYESHDQLRVHLADFMAAYNCARWLKTLSGLTPYEYIAKIWTSEPDRFIVNPIHQMPGLNT